VSTWADRVIARVRRDIASDEGFTLIEMVVALILFALVAQALAGALINGARNQLYAQRNTGAKNFAQQRIDAMRSLPYHVDRQNGSYRLVTGNSLPDELVLRTDVPNLFLIPAEADLAGAGLPGRCPQHAQHRARVAAPGQPAGGRPGQEPQRSAQPARPGGAEHGRLRLLPSPGRRGAAPLIRVT